MLVSVSKNVGPTSNLFGYIPVCIIKAETQIVMLLFFLGLMFRVFFERTTTLIFGTSVSRHSVTPFKFAFQLHQNE